jgi:hypothetical protein
MKIRMFEFECLNTAPMQKTCTRALPDITLAPGGLNAAEGRYHNCLLPRYLGRRELQGTGAQAAADIGRVA